MEAQQPEEVKKIRLAKQPTPVVQATLEPVDDEFIDKITDMMMNVSKKKPGAGKKKKKAPGQRMAVSSNTVTK